MTTNLLSVEQIKEAIEGLTVFQELCNEDYPQAGGNFRITVYEASHKAGTVIEADLSIIVINDVHNGDQHFMAQIHEYDGGSYGVVNNEHVSLFEVIAKADAAMRKFMGQ